MITIYLRKSIISDPAKKATSFIDDAAFIAILIKEALQLINHFFHASKVFNLTISQDSFPKCKTEFTSSLIFKHTHYHHKKKIFKYVNSFSSLCSNTSACLDEIVNQVAKTTSNCEKLNCLWNKRNIIAVYKATVVTSLLQINQFDVFHKNCL